MAINNQNIYIDLSMSNYFDRNKPLPMSYSLSRTIIDDFKEALVASLNRNVYLSATKKDRTISKNSVDTKEGFITGCLTILTNAKAPTKDVAFKLYEVSFMSNSVDDLTIDDEKTLKELVNQLNGYRHAIKRIMGLGKANLKKIQKTGDELAYEFMVAYMNVYNSKLVSLSNDAIALYKDAIDFWNTASISMAGSSMSWDNICLKYKGSQHKPKETKFIPEFMKKYPQYNRSNIQIYLIVYNESSCFTSNDLDVITNGKTDLLSILSKIKTLTEK